MQHVDTPLLDLRLGSGHGFPKEHRRGFVIAGCRDIARFGGIWSGGWRFPGYPLFHSLAHPQLYSG